MMKLTRKRKHHIDYNYKLEGAKLQFLNNIKYLGVNIQMYHQTLDQSEIRLSSDGFFFRLAGTVGNRGTSESSTYGKQWICRCNSASTHFHVTWLSDFIFYPKLLYKTLHQSFFYSFITILPSGSESGVTIHYSTILPQTIISPC